MKTQTSEKIPFGPLITFVAAGGAFFALANVTSGLSPVLLAILFFVLLVLPLGSLRRPPNSNRGAKNASNENSRFSILVNVLRYSWLIFGFMSIALSVWLSRRSAIEEDYWNVYRRVYSDFNHGSLVDPRETR